MNAPIKDESASRKVRQPLKLCITQLVWWQVLKTTVKLSTLQLSVSKKVNKHKTQLLSVYTDLFDNVREFEFRCKFDATEEPEDTGPTDQEQENNGKFSIFHPGKFLNEFQETEDNESQGNDDQQQEDQQPTGTEETEETDETGSADTENDDNETTEDNSNTNPNAESNTLIATLSGLVAIFLL